MVSAVGGKAGLPFRLTGWSAWTPECSSEADWLAWAGLQQPRPGVRGPAAPSDTLSRTLRRRTNPVGRCALAAASTLGHVRDARYVISTRHGEFERTVSILESLAERATPSPADFSMSVHHALAGLLSIEAKNTQGHSAISAGPESFCFGMLEAAASIVERPDQPVIYVYYDEFPGGGFADLLAERDRQLPVVVALGMAGRSTDQGEAMTVALRPRENGEPSSCHARDFIRFVLAGAQQAVSDGNRMTWLWRRG